MANPSITRTQSIVNWFRREKTNTPFYQNSAASLYESFNRHTTTQQSIVSAIYNRIAIDASNFVIKHVYNDPTSGIYQKDADSFFNDVLTVSTNSDQTPQAFMVDAIISMFEDGSVALVPETTANPYETTTWDIVSLRTAKILGYKAKTIDVEIYDGDSGKVERWPAIPKEYVAIIENPLFYIMNKSNSTFKRLTQAIALLDQANEASVNGKIDLIIHVPYTIRSEARQKIAESRRKDIEEQLKNSKYGIAYMDPTETVTQLNRPATNNLLDQVAALTVQVYAQIGVTDTILNGTADEKTMSNYRSRIVGTVVRAFTQEMNRKFLTQTARTQGQAVRYFFDVFEYATGKEMAEIAQILKTSEISSTDEMRPRFNFGPSGTPQGSNIQNPNINTTPGTTPMPTDPNINSTTTPSSIT